VGYLPGEEKGEGVEGLAVDVAQEADEQEARTLLSGDASRGGVRSLYPTQVLGMRK
jgi:hypothetical protein